MLEVVDMLPCDVEFDHFTYNLARFKGHEVGRERRGYSQLNIAFNLAICEYGQNQ